MKRHISQAGFSPIVVLIAVVVIGAASVASWRVLSANTGVLQSGTAPAATKQAPASIKDQADIRKASQSLDSTSIDSNVNPSALDADLNAVL